MLNIFQKAQTKRDRYRDNNLLRFISYHHYLNCFSTPRQEYFITVGLSFKIVAPVSIRTERFVPNLESGVSEPVKRQDWKQPL